MHPGFLTLCILHRGQMNTGVYFPSNRLRLKVCSIESDYKICSILNDSASDLGENIQHMSTETGEYER